MYKKILKNKELSNRLNKNRIYIILLLLYVLIAIIAPGFLSSGNVTSMLKSSQLYIISGIGFTFVLICGNFDLSVTSMINVGACISIGTFNALWTRFGGYSANPTAIFWAWIIGIVCACIVGSIFGLMNGLLVAKAKVHSFIVTIGSLTALAGFVYTFGGGNTLSGMDYNFPLMLDQSFFPKVPYLSVVTWRFIVTVIMVIIFEILLVKSKWGRNFYMTGSNKEVAWQAGINTDRNVIVSFVISGFCSALSGALFAISTNAAVPNFGERGIAPLIIVIASVIIGGTPMTGGQGSVVKTMVAVVVLESVFSTIIEIGAGVEFQVLWAGILLALVVLYEAVAEYRRNQRKGERPALLAEAERMQANLKNM